WYEPGVEQMEHGVLVPADVARDREPRFGALRVPRAVVELSRRVEEVVPSRIEERVGHVGFAPPLRTALRAFGVVPLFVSRERSQPGGIGAEVFDQGQQHREVLLRHTHRPATVAVDDRDRGAPVALARDTPVVQTVLYPGRGKPLGLKPGDDAALRVATRQP